MQKNFHDLNYLQFTKSKICIVWLLILMIIIVDAWNLKRSFFSTAAALFCFTTLLNDNRRTKGAKSLSLHSRSKEKIIALKLAPKKCTLLSQKSERKNANCCCLVGSFCSFEVRLNLYLLSL